MYNLSGSSPSLTNVTFSGNSATYGGGMFNNSSSSPALTNVIMWGNTESSPCTPSYVGNKDICNVNGSTPAISYSLIEGCNPGGTWDTGCGTGASGNNIISDNPPLFVGANDLRLQAESPAIDVGNGTDAPATDLDGKPRIVGGTIDLGAYERQ